MRFKNWRKMYDYIVEGNDLYDPKSGIYVFVYNDANALCFYYLSLNEVLDLLTIRGNSNEYWGAYLGIGGSILDDYKYIDDEFRYSDDQAMRDLYLRPSYDFCKENYLYDGWINTNDITIDFIKSLMGGK